MPAAVIPVAVIVDVDVGIAMPVLMIVDHQILTIVIPFSAPRSHSIVEITAPTFQRLWSIGTLIRQACPRAAITKSGQPRRQLRSSRSVCDALPRAGTIGDALPRAGTIANSLARSYSLT